MTVESTELVLAVWEAARNADPRVKDAVILATANPRCAPDEFERLSIGQVDRALLQIYRHLFGDRVEGLATCPGCGQDMAFDFSISDPSAQASIESSSKFDVVAHGYKVSFRLPTAADLNAVRMSAAAGEAKWGLLDRCINSIICGSRNIGVRQLPDKVVAAIDHAMARADPDGAMSLAFECSECSQRWQASFDPSLFLWTALDRRGQEILNEIHTLARAYGWSEKEILTVSPWRRQIYLSMVET